MVTLDWLSVAGNTIFLISYIVFVLHIYRTEQAKGVSGLAVAMWLVAFSLLGIFFLGKWMQSGRAWEFLFVYYYFAGSILSVLALMGWWKYKDGNN